MSHLGHQGSSTERHVEVCHRLNSSHQTDAYALLMPRLLQARAQLMPRSLQARFQLMPLSLQARAHHRLHVRTGRSWQAGTSKWQPW